MKKPKQKQENNISDLRDFEIIKKADDLLDAVIASSGILKKKPFTNQTLKEAKLVGSFTNTVVNAIGKKISIFKTEVFLENLPKKLSQIKKLKKSGHFK